MCYEREEGLVADRNDISLQVLREIGSNGKGNIPGHAAGNVISGSVPGDVVEAKMGGFREW